MTFRFGEGGERDEGGKFAKQIEIHNPFFYFCWLWNLGEEETTKQKSGIICYILKEHA